ncbi:MAG: LuxR C-terminal-related transcriptional regulator [Pseudomonadota bacterium]
MSLRRSDWEFDGFVDDLHDAATSDRWDDIAARLAQYLSRSHLIFGGYGPTLGMTRRGIAGFSTTDYQELQQRFAEGAAAYAQRLAQRENQQADHSGDVGPEIQSYQSLNDHVRSRHGMSPEVGAILGHSDQETELVVVAHDSDRLGHDPEVIQRFFRAVPHIRRAYATSQVIRRQKVLLTTLAAAFDDISAGVVLCDAEARILQMNTMARDLFGEQDGIVWQAGRLSAYDRGARLALSTQIADAAERRGEAGRSTLLAPRSGALPIIITIGSYVPGIAVVFAEDPERDVAPDLDRLQTAGGLSRAQARVARLAVSGATNAIIAERIGVSENTVKTHLLRVFGKLDCRDRRGLALRLAALRGILN